MSSFFQDVSQGVDKVEADFLGPTYYYYKMIKSPSQLGMSSEGSLSTAADDVAGLINYAQLLVEGPSRASVTGKALGDKYFLKTAGQCTDTTTKQKVDRYMYIDNVPSGNIPFISSGLGMDFSSFEGLLPGVLSDVGKLDPLPLFSSFMQGASPPCQEIVMETISPGNVVGSAAHFVPVAEIRNMDPCTFQDQRNPVTGSGCTEAFISANEKLRRDGDLRPRIRGRIRTNMRRRPFLNMYHLGVGIMLVYLLSALYRKK